MKRILAAALLLITLTGLLTLPARAAEAAPSVSAASAILMEKNSRTVLYEKDADTQRLIASLTKLLTAIVVLEHASTEELVEIKAEYTMVEGSSMYLKEGETYSVYHLLHGLLLHSGNDAATALACYISGSEAEFAKLMNAKAAELGMTNSNFENPHGLDGKAHYSTARDLAILTAAAMDVPLIAEIMSIKEITMEGRQYTNHNKLLWNCEGVIGGKTGYTQAAGRTLISVCRRNDVTLICVTLDDGDDWNDHSNLYDWGYSNSEYRQLVAKGERFGGLPLISGVAEGVGLEAGEDFYLFCMKGEAPEIETQLVVPDFAYAPVTAGDRAGELLILSGGRVLGDVKIVYTSSIPRDEAQRLSRWEQLKRSWYLSNMDAHYYLEAWFGAREAAETAFSRGPVLP